MTQDGYPEGPPRDQGESAPPADREGLSSPGSAPPTLSSVGPSPLYEDLEKTSPVPRPARRAEQPGEALPSTEDPAPPRGDPVPETTSASTFFEVATTDDRYQDGKISERPVFLDSGRRPTPRPTQVLRQIVRQEILDRLPTLPTLPTLSRRRFGAMAVASLEEATVETGANATVVKIRSRVIPREAIPLVGAVLAGAVSASASGWGESRPHHVASMVTVTETNTSPSRSTVAPSPVPLGRRTDVNTLDQAIASAEDRGAQTQAARAIRVAQLAVAKHNAHHAKESHKAATHKQSQPKLANSHARLASTPSIPQAKVTITRHPSQSKPTAHRRKRPHPHRKIPTVNKSGGTPATGSTPPIQPPAPILLCADGVTPYPDCVGTTINPVAPPPRLPTDAVSPPSP